MVIASLCQSLNIVSAATLVAEEALLIDALTGIYNRRYFDRRLQEEMSRSRRHGTPLSLVLLDADHFKKINDTHGHVGGDEVLRSIGLLMTQSLRSADAFWRYGGEEFALVLPNTTIEAAELLARRLLKKVSHGVEAATGIPITMSGGLTAFGADDQLASAMIGRADAALYEAKASGRNCVHVRPATATGWLDSAWTKPRPPL
ncbi:MAG: GGDEF domain-containing protein [Acidobacteriota bacterium]